MKKIKYTFLFVCGFTLCSCFDGSSSTKITRMIDNPTENEIKLAIDGNELIIPAQSNINYTFEYGKHNLTYNNESLDFIVKPAKFGTPGFINPTQSNYILHTFIYATTNTSAEDFDKKYEEALNNVNVILNGEQTEVRLPIKVINDIFIEHNHKNWDFSLDDDPLDELVEDVGKNQSVQFSRVKIFRVNDYIKFLKDNELEDDFIFPNKSVKLSEINQNVFPIINVEGIACAEGKKYLTEILDDWKNLFTLTGSDFADKYEKLGGDEGQVELSKSKALCNKNNDPQSSYYNAYTQLSNVLDKTRYLHFFVIK
jgi:hypothetical protein